MWQAAILAWLLGVLSIHEMCPSLQQPPCVSWEGRLWPAFSHAHMHSSDHTISVSLQPAYFSILAPPFPYHSMLAPPGCMLGGPYPDDPQTKTPNGEDLSMISAGGAQAHTVSAAAGWGAAAAGRGDAAAAACPPPPSCWWGSSRCPPLPAVEEGGMGVVLLLHAPHPSSW